MRLQAAQNIAQYMQAVDSLTKDVDELAFPLRGLRKLYRLPSASPVTYSKAIKGLKKEVIQVNDNVYPVGQRSLDKALQVSQAPVLYDRYGGRICVAVWRASSK